jgi:hypothetical protein
MMLSYSLMIDRAFLSALAANTSAFWGSAVASVSAILANANPLLPEAAVSPGWGRRQALATAPLSA